ncbi:protein Star-like [Cloeon dipterum]|uniref:protein Star-like n=1 Tax=Cloeon dipterum TaxID=197152 RepID=UPI00321FEDF2
MEIMTVVLLTMLRHKTLWLLVALACFVVTVQLCLWIFLMQVQLGLMSAEIRDLSSNVHQSNDFVRDYMHAYASSPIDDDVRFFYTYPKSEVKSLNNLSQEDPLLIKHIKKYLLIRPPKHFKPRIFDDESKGQGKRISELFKRKTGGIFVEYGAANGHYESNTLFLEMRYNWTGLLIVPNPYNFGLRYRRHRNAWLLPVCISLKKSPMMAKFNLERVSPDVNVHCMPLYSILKAFNATSIDFFSLDAQGNELDVLRTLPFDGFDIKTFSINLSNINGSKEHLQQFMTSKGYNKLPSTPELERNNSKLALEDCIFVKKK